MVFMDAGAAHRVQHDINQIYEAIARFLSKMNWESRMQPEAVPQIDIEVEAAPPEQALLAGESRPVLEGQPQHLRLEGRDFAALPGRDLEPLALPPRSPLNLDPAEVPIRIQLGDAVIEHPLPLLLPALKEWHPDQIVTLRQMLEYPVESERSLPVEMAHTAARIEVDNLECFAIADGQIQINTLYPEIVKIQAGAIAAGQLNATPDQVEDLSRYMLQHYAPEQPRGRRDLYVMDEQQGVNVALSPERDIILDFDELNSDSVVEVPENLTNDLNTVYQLLHEELQWQRNLPPQTPMPQKLPAFFLNAETQETSQGSSDSQRPEARLRPISEVETTTGQQLGTIEGLHPEVLSKSPVVRVDVDDLERPRVTSSGVGHVEGAEDEVETEEIEQTLKAGSQENPRIGMVALDQLQSFFDQTGVRELEGPEMGMVIQPQASGLVASTSDGHLLILNGDRVQTNFTPAEIQQLGEMAQEATLALAAHEIRSGTVRQWHPEMDRS